MVSTTAKTWKTSAQRARALAEVAEYFQTSTSSNSKQLVVSSILQANDCKNMRVITVIPQGQASTPKTDICQTWTPNTSTNQHQHEHVRIGPRLCPPTSTKQPTLATRRRINRSPKPATTKCSGVQTNTSTHDRLMQKSRVAGYFFHCRTACLSAGTLLL